MNGFILCWGNVLGDEKKGKGKHKACDVGGMKKRFRTCWFENTKEREIKKPSVRKIHLINNRFVRNLIHFEVKCFVMHIECIEKAKRDERKKNKRKFNLPQVNCSSNITLEVVCALESSWYVYISAHSLTVLHCAMKTPWGCENGSFYSEANARWSIRIKVRFRIYGKARILLESFKASREGRFHIYVKAHRVTNMRYENYPASKLNVPKLPPRKLAIILMEKPSR